MKRGGLRVSSRADLPARYQGASANKFGAQKVAVDGIEFDSKREAARYCALRVDEKAGHVRDIKVHVPIQVEVNGVHVFTYLCDFVYERRHRIDQPPSLWMKHYEDSKGYRKGAVYQLFRLKKAVIAAAMGVTVVEV